MLILKDFRINPSGRLVWASVYNSKESSTKTYNEAGFLELALSKRVLGASCDYTNYRKRVMELRRDGVGLSSRIEVVPENRRNRFPDYTDVNKSYNEALDMQDDTVYIKRKSSALEKSKVVKAKKVLLVAIQQSKEPREVYMSDYLVDCYRLVRSSGEFEDVVHNFEQEVGVL